MNYTAENLLSELQMQGVFIQPTTAGRLFIDGTLSDAQFSAVKELKPQIVNLINENSLYRFGTNQHLFFDLDKAFRVFDVSSNSANLFFSALVEYTEKHAGNEKKELCFNQPTIDAYKSELRLCHALESSGGGESLQTAFDGFIETHTLGKAFGDWLQEKDAPLRQVWIYDGGNEIDYLVGNAVQTAIFCGFWSAKNPDVKYEIANI